MTSYTYRPLGGDSHIRILRINPAPSDDRLSGTLTHKLLDDRPVYDALSYTWGAPDMSRTIIIDGHELSITANLDSALRRMRSRSGAEPTTIWADGICVNQGDIRERNHQVRLMRRVYSECRRCLIYLGEEADGSEQLPLFIEKLVDSMVLIARSNVARQRFSIDLSLPKTEDDGWKVLAAFLRRPWFRRIWIIQEFCLPADVRMICGSWEIPGAYLAVLMGTGIMELSGALLDTLGEEGSKAMLAQKIHLRLRMCLGRDVGIRTLTAESIPTPTYEGIPRWLTLIWLLENCRLCDATDPRDHFYALLGLAADVGDSSLVADYSKGLEEVEMEFGGFLIKSGFGVSLLYGACEDHGRAGVLPSWLPNFCGVGQSSLSIWSNKSEEKLAAKITSGWDDRTLLVSGRRLDVIKVLGRARGDEFWLDGWIQEVDSLVAQVDSYPSGVDIEEALWRTITTNRSVDGKTPAPEEYYDIYRRSRDTDLFERHYRNLFPYEALESFHEVFRFHHAVRTGRFCITNGGLFAMVPDYAQMDDVIFVIEGDPQRATFVIRRDRGRDREDFDYTWVGHAYVHDIWKVHNYGKLGWEDIVLR
ncbi:hypothetical protein NW767_015640 [Fusarium falciforme]|nr:hypothetical protein NW767_015640 [Fusarium falciforme]